VGLDEFIDFCREVNAEPMIAANTGFGDDYSAAQEVEYVNGGADTIGGSWRVKNGHAEPYNVKYWCVGNEMFGNWQLGYMRLDHYTLKHNRVARAMLKADPSLKLVGVGDLGPPDARDRWSEGMLRNCRDHMHYISEHFYRGRTPWGEQTPDNVPDHVAMLKNSIREKADGHRKLQGELGMLPDNLMPIAMDEWNYWHRDYDFGELGCHYDLADALGVAAGLHEYFRQTDYIHMANYAQTVNVIGCIKTTKTDAFLDTTALPLMLYRKHFGSKPLAVEGDQDKLHVDVAAALSEDEKTLTVGVVNPNKDPVAVRLSATGLKLGTQGRQWVVAGDDPKAINDAGKPNVAARESETAVEGVWEVPGYAFAILAAPVE
jgi:alpha-N-arabinofuranosidase